MRSVWKGSVAFGMVTIPVRLYTATQEHDVKFHQVHGADGGRIRYRRVCEICGQEVPYEEIDRAVEQPDGTLVVVAKDELDALAVPTGHEIDVVQFVPAEQIDPVLFARSYYLEPDAQAVKPYVLLREALRDTDRIAIGRVALRQRERLAALRVRDDVIIVQTMLWPDEVRDPAFEVLSTEVALRPQEQQMAHALVESLTSDFDSDSFTDRYTEAVAGLVAAKAADPGATRPSAPEPVEAQQAPATDLVEALRASVEKAKAERSGSSAGETVAGSGKASRRRSA
ncbi:MAG TPA: Ku protein [Pseudonocardiaceae bacterium]|jgi:DNA end-binding protein Ku|nr:Ku protein [Pseudonocardiaceae bacterium]